MPTPKNTPLHMLFATLMIVMLGFGIAIPLMPFFVLHYQASATALGLIMSLYSLMQFLFAPFWGKVSDRVGRKPVLLIGIAGYGLSFFLQAISPNLLIFALARTLAGILSSATLPTAMAYVADTTAPAERSKGVGMLGAAMGIGMIFGPLLGGLLTRVHLDLPQSLAALLQAMVDPATGNIINLSVPFFVSSFLALFTLPIVYAYLPESLTPLQRVYQPPATQPLSGDKPSRPGTMLRGLRGPAGFLFALAFLIAFALANLEAVLALYGKQRFAMGPSEVGMLMGAIGVLAVLLQGMFIGPITRRLGEVRIIQGGLVIGMFGFIGMAFAPTKPLLYAAALFFSAGNVLLQPSVTSLISRRGQTGQGELMGLNNSFMSLGRGVGPLWAGFAYDIYWTLSFWTGALVQLLAFLGSLSLFSHLPEPSPSPADPEPLLPAD